MVKPRFPLQPIDRQPITSQNVLYSDPGKKTKRASGKFLNKRLRAGHAMRREGPRYPYKGPDSKWYHIGLDHITVLRKRKSRR